LIAHEPNHLIAHEPNHLIAHEPNHFIAHQPSAGTKVNRENLKDDSGLDVVDKNAAAFT
jgi:hypothetical protein